MLLSWLVVGELCALLQNVYIARENRIFKLLASNIAELLIIICALHMYGNYDVFNALQAWIIQHELSIVQLCVQLSCLILSPI